MTSLSDRERRFEQCRSQLESRGQQHVLRWWGDLGPGERDLLLADLETIPWDLIDGLVQSHVLARPRQTLPHDLKPATVYPHYPEPSRKAMYEEAIALGRRLLGGGKVAVLTVAGGQGTRLGYDGPKGAVVVTPVGEKTLFELFAEMIKAACRRYETPIPWYIMTSPANHDQTARFLKSRDFLGLPEEDVFLFSQGMLPQFGFDGRILMQARHSIALGPDGHGGALKGLVTSGALNDMKRRGTEIITYFQVDNPLVKPFDPLFIGLHAKTGSEMSSKVASKADDLERVGNVCTFEGKVVVIEYSEFPETYARAKTPDGRRMFDAGNLAIHALDVGFVDRVVGRSFQLPFRRAEKAVPCIDESGMLQTPAKPNAVKLEMFIFDALPLARNPLVLEVDRTEEFSPVKNATGVDSLETARRDQVARACRWLQAAGVSIPRKADGQPDVTVAILPSFALDAEDVKAQIHRIQPLTPGQLLVMD